MLADFYIPRLSNDMKIAIQKKNFKNFVNKISFLIKFHFF